VLGVLALVYFGLQRVGGMSDRFFASTLDGANGQVRYLVGDYRCMDGHTMNSILLSK
jgi:hypothetical protein